MKSTRLYLIATFLGGLTLVGAAHAQSSASTPEEHAICRAAIPPVPPGASADWMHTHHYCDCILYRYRALRNMGDRNKFTYLLGEASDGCEYVLRAASRSFSLRPRIHIDNARAYALKGNTERASQQYLLAIELKPTEVDAFVELVDLQRKRGHAALALETVTRGLRHNPDAKSLQKRYLELGGKQPFPEPIARATPEPEPKGVEQPGEADALGEHPPAAPQEATEPRALSAPEASGEGNAVLEGGCRFCPPEEIQRRWKESFGGTK
jgi:tetratricopeptide (TPR) repeat protein